MNQKATRVSRYHTNLRQEPAQIVKMKEAELDAAGEIVKPPEPMLNEDGTPVVEDVTVDLLAFTDGDTGEEWLFFADPDFRVEIIRICSQGMDESQKQRAMQHLTGGIVIAPAGALPPNPAGGNREQRRAAARSGRGR